MEKSRIFISYSHDDNKKMTLLSRLIDEKDNLESIVIANRKSPQSPLSDKVTKGIHEADILIPILTRKSILNQWVNQEIGYTYSFENKTIIPLVEDSIMERLKGFIHKQIDLPYVFNGFDGNPRKESNSFKKVAVSLINDLSGNDSQTNENLKSADQSKNTNNFNASNSTSILEKSKIYLAKPGFNSTLSGRFLQQEKGLVSIWALVTDIHNSITEKQKPLYILSYATNNGKEMKNPMMARYPNSWYIARITPTNEKPTGFWKFECNGIEKKSLEIISDKILDGWHMFTVTWSKEDNYVMFLIDKEIIEKKEFSVWPTNFSKSIFVGTWPSRARELFFNSQLLIPKTINKGYNKNLINTLYSSKPE